MDDFWKENETETETINENETETPVPVNMPDAASTQDCTSVRPAENKLPAEQPEPEPVPERSAYSDAGYVPAADASAVPRSYHCAAPAEKKPRKEKKPRRGVPWAGMIAACLVCAILGGVAGGALLGLLHRPEQAAAQSPVTETAEKPAASGSSTGAEITVAKPANSGGTQVVTNLVASGQELSPTEIYYNLALQQVVGVTTEITYTNYFGYTTSGAVSGSGFIISPDGYILTNHHVIEDAVKGGYEVKVLTSDGTQYVASVVGYEEDNDVAVLKIDGAELNAAIIGDSDSMQVGEPVYAVGNPLGELEYTMTSGMVSALDREIAFKDSGTGVSKTVNMFQIDAAINSGNSGGPVYNKRGEVIGIASAKYSSTGIEGLAFAIPINDAVKIANDLISDGFVRGKAYLGASLGTVSASAAQYYGLVEGAIVANVTEGSAADRAGLRVNDIVVAIDDTEIKSSAAFLSAKRGYRAGDSAVLKIWRNGDDLELTVVFDEETPELLETENEQQTVQEQKPQQQQPSGGWGSGDFNDLFEYFFGGIPFGR